MFLLRDIQWAKEWLNRHKIDPAKPLIAVFPGGGASWGKAARYKRWAAPKYAQLIDKIIENFDAAIILMGDSKEEELCREVASLAHFPLHFAVGETSLLGLAALLMQCQGAIVNDGGPLHVAAAVGVKTVSIFGPVDPQVYGPYPVGESYRGAKGSALPALLPSFSYGRIAGISVVCVNYPSKKFIERSKISYERSFY